MEPLTLLAGGALVIVGVLIGRFAPGRRRGPKPIEPVCGCSHHHAYHEPDTGMCAGKIEVNVYDAGRYAGTKLVTCTCQQYSGPQPLPSMYAPELSS